MCKKCNVEILSNHTYCPLCQNPIKGIGKEIFPYVPTIQKRYHLFFKILLLCSISISLLSIFLDIIIPTKIHFSIYIVAGLLCLNIILKISLTKRENIPRSILRQVVVISILTWLWDYFTGWHGFSISYVIPILCMVGSLDMIILAKVMKLYMDEQLIYFIDIVILGLVPSIFLLLNLVNPRLPSLICIFLNILAFFIILIFRWDKVIEELKRRLHI